MKRACVLAISALFAVTPVAAWAAPVETILHHFAGGTDGSTPEGNLVAKADGTLYGVTVRGGYLNAGTVFEAKPPAPGKTAWTVRVIHVFKGGSDGANPTAGLVLASDGKLYGTTSQGGTGNAGTVFRLKPPSAGGTVWTKTVLYRFSLATDGTSPQGELAIGGNGMLYGTAGLGGAHGAGTVFRLTPPTAGKILWTHKILHHFAGGIAGANPVGLARATDGHLYGATAAGGSTANGTVWALIPPAAGGTVWTKRVLRHFQGNPDGALPMAGPTLAAGGVLFGTTEYGGTGDKGTVYRLTPPAPGKTAWTETILHRFVGGYGGANPFAGVTTDAAGVVYGTTVDLSYGGGTVFKLTPPAGGTGVWTKTILHRFSAAADGNAPYAAPLRNAAGVIFGTTGYGGAHGQGTLFKVTP